MHSPSPLSIWSPLVVLALLGCAEDAAIDYAPGQTAWPQVIHDDGVQWHRSPEFTTADQHRLSDYAAQHSSLFDNPLVRGDPTIYTDDAGGRRLYWAQPAVGGTQWLYIQFGPTETAFDEGVGSPFPAPIP